MSGEPTGDIPPLEPWQVELAERALRGEPVVAPASRRHGKAQATLYAAALMEAECLPWDVAGPPESARLVRRTARELAARMTDYLGRQL